MKYFFCRKALL